MKTIPLLKADVDAIFATATTQGEVLTRLYQLVYPNWDDVEQIHDFPQVHPSTGDYLMQQAITFDRRHHPDVLPGGAWLNSGFGSRGRDLHEWEVAPALATLRSAARTPETAPALALQAAA